MKLSEIKHDDRVYEPDESHGFAHKSFADSSWSHLMNFGEHEYMWKQIGPEYRVAVNGKPVLTLELKPKTVRVPGGNLTGIVSDGISSNREIRGTGLVLSVYKELVRRGQIIFSSQTQTTGSRRLWEKLIKSGVGKAFLVCEDSTARFYSRKVGPELDRVLLTGEPDDLIHEAYGTDHTYWVIIPHDLVLGLESKAVPLKTVMESTDVDYKERFRNQIAKGTLYHATSLSKSRSILKNGLRAGSYFSLNDQAWDGEIVLEVQGDKIAQFIYPDPEHLLDHPQIRKGGGLISFNSVAKNMDPDELFEMVFDVYGGVPDGLWLYCKAPVPPEFIKERE